MDPAKVFVWKIDDLEQICRNPTTPGLLQAAAILRWLLLEQPAIVNDVCRRIGYKLQFRVLQDPDSHKSDFERGHPKNRDAILFQYENIDAEGLGLQAGHVANLQQFLAYQMQMAGGEYVTVRETIKYLANQAGGVHFETPTEPKLKILHDLNAGATREDISWGMRAIEDIARITLRGLEPVYKALRA